MSSLLPVAIYGLEVPPGEVMVPAQAEFPATIRITMAAIDPTEEPEADEEGNLPSVPRSTLKVIKARIDAFDDDEDDEDEDSYLEKLLANGEDDEEDSDEDDEPNGGPSDPAKSKKAKQEAALKKLIAAAQDSDEDMEEADATPNGTKSKKGKEKASDEDDEDSDEESDMDEGLGLEQFVVCTLDTERNYQQPLDVTINEDEKVFFIVSGTHTIHLTGNYVIADDDEESSDDEDDYGDYDMTPEIDDVLDAQDELSDDVLDEIDQADRVNEIDTDEEEAPKLVTAPAKKGKNKRPAEEAPESLDDMISKENKEEPKLSKKQLKKLKNNKGEAVAAEAAKGASKETPTKADKKVQFAKNLEQGPTGSAEKAKQQDKKATPGVKVVQGVTIDDRKVGTGRTAKAGDKVGMRYIGKLQSNGKVFDSNKKGAPFSFKLGKGEVIKGWDIGVAGMAVGGERRLIIPANQAYGSRSMPEIPANSTLVFDVKLLEIK